MLQRRGPWQQGHRTTAPPRTTATGNATHRIPPRPSRPDGIVALSKYRTVLGSCGSRTGRFTVPDHPWCSDGPPVPHSTLLTGAEACVLSRCHDLTSTKDRWHRHLVPTSYVLLEATVLSLASTSITAETQTTIPRGCLDLDHHHTYSCSSSYSFLSTMTAVPRFIGPNSP